MYFDLTDEQRAFQRSAEEFARDVVAPRAASIDENGAYPHDVIAAAAKRGLAAVQQSSTRNNEGNEAHESHPRADT